VSAQLYGPVCIDLNDGPVTADYSRGFDGKPTARLIVGEGTQSIAVSITNATPDAIDQLQEAVAQLAAWTKRMSQLQSLPEVA
jgi:hypothetical protein